MEADNNELDNNKVTPKTPPVIAAQNNKIAITGFICMLAGPAVLLLGGFFSGKFGYFHLTAAYIVSWTAIILPAVGVILSIISLPKRMKTGKLGRSLAISTLIMCNPFFYYFYFIICAISSATLAGLSWM